MTLPSGKKKVVSVGNYRFTGKLLGKGNFAKVEEAIHTVLNVKVAIKIMDINQIKEEYVIRNLCREAKIMSKLNHPCIAALYQTIQRSDNVYYLITELVSGGDLCSFVKSQKEGKLEERTARIYARQFASALAHMHSMGIVHRDLKMENVMLNSIQTQIKIVDFGLSNVWSLNSPLKTHCGSPEYAAPELFVTGRHYGAEVDLWSLGIILYGMVMGQLPFVSSRSDYVSSQERRRKLVAKINKGLSSSHRKVLVCFSSEFRHILSRLLAAEASKRITTKELLLHPWITDKGRKLVRGNPIKILDAHWQAKVITEIGALLRAEPRSVMSSIAHDPLGKVGGMFNILVHKQQLALLTGDGITKTLPSLTILEYPDAQKAAFKSVPPLKVSTARTIQEKKPTTLMKNIGGYYTPRLETENRVSTSPVKHRTPQVSNINKKESIIKTRPCTVQSPIVAEAVQFLDYRNFKSPSLRRRAYSAGITPKTNRQPSPSTEKARQLSALAARTAGATESNTRNRVSENDGKKKSITDALKAVKRLPQVGARQTSVLNTAHRQKELLLRVRTAEVEKTRSQSAQTTSGKRPLTTAGQARCNLERSSKEHSASLPVNKQSGSRNVESRPSTNTKPLSKQKREIVTRQETWEKSPLAYGDIIIQSPRIAQKNKKHVISDPIARSIAEYVANNAGQLYNFSWFKK